MMSMKGMAERGGGRKGREGGRVGAGWGGGGEGGGAVGEGLRARITYFVRIPR